MWKQQLNRRHREGKIQSVLPGGAICNLEGSENLIVAGGAEGDFLYDEAGRRYINFSESTNILGHRNPEVMRIISECMKQGFIHYPLTVSFPKVAEEVAGGIEGGLSGMPGGASCVFTSSGSEACDAALSVMSGLGPVVTVEGGYHGNTGQFMRKKETDRLKYGSEFEIPFPHDESVLGEMEALVRKGARSIIVEPVQAEGGFRKVYDSFLRDLRRDFSDLVICVDECYTGFGKTGRPFSYQWFGIRPDILVIGKALGGGGLPVGMAIFDGHMRESPVLGAFRNGAFGSSAGNVMALHVARYIISVVSEPDF